MTDKEKLDAVRAEIHRLVDVRGYNREMANDLFTFMDSLPNEPVSEDLEEAAIAYNKKAVNSHSKKVNFVVAGKVPNEHFIAGAKWQEEKDNEEYLEGYHQAEKDLELTWKDIETIGELRLNVALELRRKELESPIKSPLKFTTEDICKEVLRRFKDMKGE